ncbi:MAG: PCP reductase family protein [Rhodothermales bacterium]|nr:PCP reductase family protein [Rhodothermales bacterium]MBO6778140.1 PCP reductase family protein [Rhodothermales bacterium]
MKFLCVDCDEPMALKEALGPDNGSLSVVFECGTCGRQTAMLTNHMETQMIHSLGVKVGGRTEPAAPMETIRDNLDGFDAPSPEEPAPHTAEWYAQKMGAAPKSEGGGCPFSGMMAPQIEAAEGLKWTAEAEARMERIPEFVRPIVRKGIEDTARSEGAAVVDVSYLERARGQMGM